VNAGGRIDQEDRPPLVTVPKGSLADTATMNDAINHIHRRGRAIDRLRAVTTGAAVAGIAGTVGFGALAAATWSGEPNARTAAGLSSGAGDDSGSTRANTERDDAENGSNGGSDDGGPLFGTQPGDAFGTIPNEGARQNPTFVRPAQPGSRSHATSGGSH
jgi:hypothetical protein